MRSMAWTKTLVLLSLSMVAAQIVPEPRNWEGHYNLPIEFNSSRTVKLTAVADGNILSGESQKEFKDDTEFYSGTMNEHVGHVFMGLCETGDYSLPGRIVEIDPVLGYPNQFIESEDITGCPIGMASNHLNGDMYATIYISSNYPQPQEPRLPDQQAFARSEILKISPTGDVSVFARDLTGCILRDIPGYTPDFMSPAPYPVVGDPGCFAYLEHIVRSCQTGDLYVSQNMRIEDTRYGANILRISPDGSTSEVYKTIQDCSINGKTGLDDPNCNPTQGSRIMGMTIDCATDIIYASRTIGNGEQNDVIIITPDKVATLASSLDGDDFYGLHGLAFHRPSQSVLVAEEGRSFDGHRIIQANLTGEVSVFTISSRLVRPSVVIVENNDDAKLSFEMAYKGSRLRGTVDAVSSTAGDLPGLFVANSGDRRQLSDPTIKLLNSECFNPENPLDSWMGCSKIVPCTEDDWFNGLCRTEVAQAIEVVRRGKNVMSITIDSSDDVSPPPNTNDPPGTEDSSNSEGFFNNTFIMASLAVGGVAVFGSFMFIARRKMGDSSSGRRDLADDDVKLFKNMGGGAHSRYVNQPRDRQGSTSTTGRGGNHKYESSYMSFGDSFEEPFLADGYYTNPVPPHERRPSVDHRKEAQESNLLSCGVQYTLRFEDISFEEQIGRGSSGLVYRGHWHNVEVAIKSVVSGFSCAGALDKKDPNSGALLELQREAQILSKLNHPHIIRFHGVSLQTEVNTFHFVMELCDMSMEELVYHAEEDVSVFQLCNVLLETALAMEYIHSQSSAILHRDLKPANILLSPSGSVRVCDFGLSRVMVSASGLPENTPLAGHQQSMSQRIGTPLFMAPELFTSGSYSTSVDVFSFAICAATFFNRAPPFSDPATEDLSAYELIDRILGGLRPTLPESCPKKLRDLIQQCWHPDPKFRPQFSQIVFALQHIDDDEAVDIATRFDDERLNSTGTAIEARDGDTWDHGHQYRNETDSPAVTNQLDDLDAWGRSSSSLGMDKANKKKSERTSHRRRHQLWTASPQMNAVIPPRAPTEVKGVVRKQPSENKVVVGELPLPPQALKDSIVTASFGSTASSASPHSRDNSNDGYRHENKLSTDWHKSVLYALRTDSFDMRKMVRVPKEFTYSMDRSEMDEKTVAERGKLTVQLGTEWTFMQLYDLYNDMTALLNVFGECCTEHSCPTMSAGPAFTYCLKAGEEASGGSVEGTGNHEVSAPRYINTSMAWIENQLTAMEDLCGSFEAPDLTFFCDARASFISARTLSTNSSVRQLSSNCPSQLVKDLRKTKTNTMSDDEIVRMVRARGLAVSRQLFVMFAHLYHSHLEEIIALRMHSHLNTSLRMFILFNKESDLMPIDEMQPLAGIVKGILAEE